MSSEPPERPERALLSVRNLQRRIPIDSARLRAFLREVAPALGASAGSATVALVTDGRMRTLNRDFRGLDKPTDVLSFRSARKGDSRGYLGDIVISVETAERQARRLRSSLPRELEILALHGFLHLLGYDHETDDGEMRRLEYRLRRKLRISRKGRAPKDAGRAVLEPMRRAHTNKGRGR
jgi:probable rRNA maturation factor